LATIILSLSGSVALAASEDVPEVASEPLETASDDHELSLTTQVPSALQAGDEMFDHLLPLRRPCLAERPCALALSEPTSPLPGLLPAAQFLGALLARQLSEREALCIHDPEGRWAQRAGEPLGACPPLDEPHQVHVRIDPAGDGFLASVTFVETVPTLDGGRALLPAGRPAFSAPAPSRLRLRTTFDEARDLSFAADQLATALGDALGTEEPSAFDVFLKPPESPLFHFNLKLGNTLSTLDGFDFSAFTLRFDLELDYYIRPYLTAFIEVGLAIGNAENTSKSDSEPASASATEEEQEEEEALSADEKGSAGGKGSFSLVPVKVGLKYDPLHQYSVRPYVGVGVGLGILSDLVEADSREITLSFSGILGVAWVPFHNVGFNLETSLDFDELRVSGGSNLLFGFSFNFGVLVLI
jgi:hypothetical protein